MDSKSTAFLAVALVAANQKPDLAAAMDRPEFSL